MQDEQYCSCDAVLHHYCACLQSHSMRLLARSYDYHALHADVTADKPLAVFVHA